MILPLLLLAAAAAQPYALVIRNGHVIDGTGSPWYAADVGIRSGKIAGLGFVVELEFLKGRDKLKGYDVMSLLKYDQ